jgi:hypothetical protein
MSAIEDALPVNNARRAASELSPILGDGLMDQAAASG